MDRSAPNTAPAPRFPTPPLPTQPPERKQQPLVYCRLETRSKVSRGSPPRNPTATANPAQSPYGTPEESPTSVMVALTRVQCGGVSVTICREVDDPTDYYGTTEHAWNDARSGRFPRVQIAAPMTAGARASAAPKISVTLEPITSEQATNGQRLLFIPGGLQIVKVKLPARVACKSMNHAQKYLRKPTGRSPN